METENFIEPHSLPEKLRIKNAEVKPSLKENMLSLEYNTVKLTLDKYGWNLEGKKRAAKELGISLRTLYRILKKSENKK
jgi:transcriptional regulator with PAS, ATPase and Fis domain